VPVHVQNVACLPLEHVQDRQLLPFFSSFSLCLLGGMAVSNVFIESDQALELLCSDLLECAWPRSANLKNVMLYVTRSLLTTHDHESKQAEMDSKKSRSFMPSNLASSRRWREGGGRELRGGGLR